MTRLSSIKSRLFFVVFILFAHILFFLLGFLSDFFWYGMSQFTIDLIQPFFLSRISNSLKKIDTSKSKLLFTFPKRAQLILYIGVIVVYIPIFLFFIPYKGLWYQVLIYLYFFGLIANFLTDMFPFVRWNVLSNKNIIIGHGRYFPFIDKVIPIGGIQYVKFVKWKLLFNTIVCLKNGDKVNLELDKISQYDLQKLIEASN